MIPHQQPRLPAKSSLHSLLYKLWGLPRGNPYSGICRDHLNKKSQDKPESMLPVPESIKAHFWELVLSMHLDEVTTAVRKEKSILNFGEHLFNNHGHSVTKHECNKSWRVEGDWVTCCLGAEKLEDWSSFRLFLYNFPDVIRAVTVVAGRNKKTKTLRTPSLALKLGYNLKKVANIMEFEGRIAGDEGHHSKCAALQTNMWH